MTNDDDEISIYCLNPSCDWMGERFELVCTDDDPDNFLHCPRCEGSETEEV
jgi:hypothetical protein